MAKKMTNYETMRPAIVKAHNSGNVKAIDLQRVQDCNIDEDELKTWKRKIKDLQNRCGHYVISRAEKRYNPEMTDEMLDQKKQDIFPVWKDLLGYTDGKKFEIPVEERDLEYLTEFAWRFMATENGTVEASVKDGVFRRSVEALIGVKIARNSALGDEDTKTLKEYYDAIKSEERALEKIKKINGNIEELETVLKGIGKGDEQKPFRDYIENMINKEKENKEKQDKRAKEAKATQIAKADKAKEIETRVKRIEIK